MPSHWVTFSVLTTLVVLAGFGLVHHFARKQGMNLRLFLVVGIMWFLGLFIVVLLPIDLGSTHYESCLLKAQDCSPPLVYISSGSLLILWRIVYWSTFISTWFLVPVLQSFAISGEYTVSAKTRYALKVHVQYFTALGVLGLLAIIYIVLYYQRVNWTALLAFAMALSNAWGFLLVMFLLGHGLVAIPRQFWRMANPELQLRMLEAKAPAVMEELEEAEMERRDLILRLRKLDQRVERMHVLRPLVNHLIEKYVPTRDVAQRLVVRNGVIEEEDDDDDSGDDDAEFRGGRNRLSRPYLVKLHWRAKRVTSTVLRAQSTWQLLLENAWHLQDVLENSKPGNSKKRRFKSSLRLSQNSTQAMLAWYWHVRFYPILNYFLAGLSGVLSLTLLVSELTLHWGREFLPFEQPGLFQSVAWVLMLYLCLCTYWSLFKVKIFNVYVLAPHHMTDTPSLLFFGGYLCKLMFPLCYNVLNILRGPSFDSSFAKLMGVVNLIPLLGENYYERMPFIILIPVFVTYFRLAEKSLRLFGLSGYGWTEDSESLLLSPHSNEVEEGNAVNGEVEEGRRLILEVRRTLERRLGLPDSDGSVESLPTGRRRESSIISPLPIKSPGQIRFCEPVRDGTRAVTVNALAASPSPFPSPPKITGAVQAFLSRATDNNSLSPSSSSQLSQSRARLEQLKKKYSQQLQPQQNGGE